MVQIREVAQWFAYEGSSVEAKRASSAISTCSDGHIQEPHAIMVCKIKNKFALSKEELVCNTKYRHKFYYQRTYLLMRMNNSL